MKKQVVAAVVAALTFAACQDSTKNQPVAPEPPASAVQIVSEPVQSAPIAEEMKKRDAGSSSEDALATVAPVKVRDDGLPLQHSHKPRTNHLERAEELKETGDFDGALTEARRAIFDDPSDSQALAVITRVGKSVGQKEYVAAAYSRLAELSPEDPEPLIQQARTLISLGDNEGAVKVGRMAVEKDPTNAEAFHVIGRAFLAAGSLQDAIDNFHQAVELNPDHGYALNNLGFAYLRSNQNEQALLVLKKAAEVLPNVGYVQNNLGVALERNKQMDDAKVAYQKAMDLSPKYVKARVNVDRVSKVAKANIEIPSDAQPMAEPDSMSDVPNDAFEVPND